MEYKQTERGFGYYEFRDSSGNHCSLQDSSSVDEKVWLGIDKEHDGFIPGKEVKGHEGEMVKLGARMHLTRNQVADLLPALQFFAANGHLPGKGDTLEAKLEVNEYGEVKLIEAWREGRYSWMLKIIATQIEDMCE